MTAQGSTRLLQRAEVAALLGISLRTLDRLVRAGELPVVYLDRRPRYLADDVSRLIGSRRVSRQARSAALPDQP